MDMRALFEMETHTFCPAGSTRNIPTEMGERKWNK